MHGEIQLSGSINSKNLAALTDPGIGPHHTPRIWVVVCDRKQARLFHRQGRKLESLGKARPAIPYIKEQTNDSYGRASSSGPAAGRHSFAASDESLRHEDELFLRSLVDFLDEARKQDAFDSVVIAAAPKTLGDLRGLMDDRLKIMIRAEISKDLMHQSTDDIRDQLSNCVNFE